jgi:hypothetical protein
MQMVVVLVLVVLVLVVLVLARWLGGAGGSARRHR